MPVTSAIEVTFSPILVRDLIAASLPGPGPFTLTSTDFKPQSFTTFKAAFFDASPAAKGVLFLDPL
jgi:hypothetical protein